MKYSAEIHFVCSAFLKKAQIFYNSLLCKSDFYLPKVPRCRHSVKFSIFGKKCKSIAHNHAKEKHCKLGISFNVYEVTDQRVVERPALNVERPSYKILCLSLNKDTSYVVLSKS